MSREEAARHGYTDGHGWIETNGPIRVIESLSELGWLKDVLAETVPKEVK